MTHRYGVRLIGIACSAFVVGVAACGSPTAPTTPTPEQLALYFDSLYSANLANGTHADSFFAYSLAGIVEFLPAFGAHRSTITLTTAGGSERWYGFTYDILGGGDSDIYTVAYSDNNLTDLFIAGMEFSGGYPVSRVYMYTNKLATIVEDSVASVSSVLTSVNPLCSLQSGLAADIEFRLIAQSYTCQVATFVVSLSATFPAAAGLGPLQSVAFSNVGFTGIRQVNIIDPEHGGPGPTRIAALLDRLRAWRARRATGAYGH